MLFQIRHTTRHEYSRPVFLEPHTLRLRPRCDASQRVRRHHLQIQPAPTGFSEGVDVEGNAFACAWFDELLSEIEIQVDLEVETLRRNPFDYLITDPGAAQLPVTYPVPTTTLLASALACAEDADVTQFAAQVRAQTGPDTQVFLRALTETLCRNWEVVVREEGPPLPAGRTLRERCGSCRDLSVLFMETCRRVGLAARFVSGYQAGDPIQERRYLHAWTEVYLPGAGWRGYDPTLGLAVADGHVAVAASCLPGYAAPILGTYRGDGETAHFDVELEIKTAPGPPGTAPHEEQQ